MINLNLYVESKSFIGFSNIIIIKYKLVLCVCVYVINFNILINYYIKILYYIIILKLKLY